MRWRRPSATTVFAILMVLSFLGLFLPPSSLNTFRAGLNSLLAPSAVSTNYLLRYFTAREPLPTSLDSRQLNQIYNRLRQLERQNAFLHMQWTQQVRKYAQAERLRERLLLENYSLIPANVYGYTLPGRAILSIDQGSIVGLKKGLWVVGFPEGSSTASAWESLACAVLVGRIAEVQPHTAQIRLLTDPGNHNQPKISVYLYLPSAGGVLEILPKCPLINIEPTASGLLIAKDVPADSDDGSGISSDSLIGTSVVSDAMDNLPAGLAIGRVVKITRSPSNLAFWDLTIEPYTARAQLYSVMVLRPIWPDK